MSSVRRFFARVHGVWVRSVPRPSGLAAGRERDAASGWSARFDDGDVYERSFVAIVSESLARQSFGSEDPIGHRIMCGFDQPDKWMTIVGVVGDVRQDSPASAPGPELYMPLRQHPYAANEVQIVVRTSVPPESLTEAVRQAARSLSPELATRVHVIDTLGVIGYVLSVDVRFDADKLKRAYEDEKVRTREWGRVVARLYVQRIDTLYAAENAQTLRVLQSLHFHALTGQRKGQYAVDLGPSYRLILAFQDRAMTVVQVEEVSKHYDD